MAGADTPTVHQLKIGLQGAAPPLWRRLQIPSAASLGFLHVVIQQTFGWNGYHLHRFHDERGREWGDRAYSDGGAYGAATFADEEEADLGKVLRTEGAALWYVYDFGDDWRHRIDVEKIIPLDPDVTYPRCTGGRRAAPPAEDIGGIWGLEEVAYLVTHQEEDPPEHLEDLVSDLRDRGYDPSAFDPAELTRRLSGLKVRTAAAGAKSVTTRTRTRPRIRRRTSEDLEFSPLGHWQADDPVQSVDDGYRTADEAPARAEVFPVITLPPTTDLAAQARRVPLIDDALRLDALADYDPAAFSAELTGWLAGRDETSAVTQLLDAIPGADPDLARRRVAAISALTMAKPSDGLEILRDAAASAPDGRRHVAAGVLANLGQEPPHYRETGQQWLLIDRLTALSDGDRNERLPEDLLEAIAAQADELWRCGHPAAADTIEATATALRDGDKTLAKRLRRCAHKARAR